jgi:hypothetical protein
LIQQKFVLHPEDLDIVMNMEASPVGDSGGMEQV